MKNKILLTLAVCIGTFASAIAQTIPNYSFETWVTDTNYLSLTLTTPTTLDTTINLVPQGWTTGDEISNGNVFSHKVLVTRSATSYTGTYSIQLRSDSLYTTLYDIDGTGFNQAINFVCPGFAICGNFPINLTAFTGLGSSFNPALLPGAGIPVSARYGKMGGYLKYTPVGGDTAYIVAILRQGPNVVATATYKRYTTDANFTYFEAPFIYQNCLMPDTMVYTISSGDPYSVTTVALTGGQTGLHIGSTLLADSVFFGDTVVYGIAYPKNDSVHTSVNTPVTIGVLAGDSSCDGGAVSLDSVGVPLWGTAQIAGDSIIYTPNNGFSGLDTFYYGAAVGIGPTATARVVVNVSGWPAGISQVATGKTSIYPNPASSKLYVSTANTSVTGLKIYDMLGDMIKAEGFTSETAVDLTTFSNGLYIIQFVGNDGKMISSSRFTVIK